MGVRKGYRSIFGAKFEDLVGSAARALANSMQEDREERAADSAASMSEAHRIINDSSQPPPPVLTVSHPDRGLHIYDGRTGTNFIIIPDVTDGSFSVEVKIHGQVQYPTRVFATYQDARNWIVAAIGELRDSPEPTPVRYNPTDSYIPSRSTYEPEEGYEPLFWHGDPYGSISEEDDPDLLVPEPVANQARHQLGVNEYEAGDLIRMMLEETLETQGRLNVPIWDERHSHAADTPVWDWEFQSSKPRAGGRFTIYSTLMFRDGCLSCNCPGWTFKKSAEIRRCKHTDEVYAESRRLLRLIMARKPLPPRNQRANGEYSNRAPDPEPLKSPTKKQDGGDAEFNRKVEID